MFKNYALAALAVPALVCSVAVAEEDADLTAEQAVVLAKIQAVTGVMEILTIDEIADAPEVAAAGIDEITKQVKELNAAAAKLDQAALAAAEEEVSEDEDVAKLPELFGKVIEATAEKDFYGCEHLKKAIGDFADAL